MDIPKMFKAYLLKMTKKSPAKPKNPKKEKGPMPIYTDEEKKFVGPKKSAKTEKEKNARNKRKRKQWR